MKKYIYFVFSFFCLIIVSCGNINEEVLQLDEQTPVPEANTIFKILSLGDSYTIGQGVCGNCKFPIQLKKSLENRFESDTAINVNIIAQTGWTTANLIERIKNQSISNDYDLVTLLIGVNNQFQSKEFSIYQSEFPELVNTSIKAANGIKSKVIVISIPDYAFTPFGKGDEEISKEINMYNSFARSYCNTNDITFINITDITRQGLNNTALVANDGLHPSELAYSKFVQRISPVAFKKLKN
jgi:acyl-CoA thioesterase-1